MQRYTEPFVCTGGKDASLAVLGVSFLPSRGLGVEAGGSLMCQGVSLAG